MNPAVDHVPTIADADAGSFDDEVPAGAEAFAGTVFCAFAIAALALLPFATSPGRRALGWVQEPSAWPFFALTVSLLAGSVFVFRVVVLMRKRAFGGSIRTSLEGMDRALVYAAGFLMFLLGVSAVGFTVASMLFLQVLFWLSGLRGGKWPWIALALGAGIILAFRVGLGIWFPLPPVMSFFPDWIGNRIGAWL